MARTSRYTDPKAKSIPGISLTVPALDEGMNWSLEPVFAFKIGPSLQTTINSDWWPPNPVAALLYDACKQHIEQEQFATKKRTLSAFLSRSYFWHPAYRRLYSQGNPGPRPWNPIANTGKLSLNRTVMYADFGIRSGVRTGHREIPQFA